MRSKILITTLLVLTLFAVAQAEPMYLWVEVCEGACEDESATHATQSLVMTESQVSSGIYANTGDKVTISAHLLSIPSVRAELLYNFSYEMKDGEIVITGVVKSIQYDPSGEVKSGKRAGVHAAVKKEEMKEMVLPWLDDNITFWFWISDSATPDDAKK